MADVRRHGSRARSAIFAPLSDVGRAGQVEERLTQAIRSGVLAEGERLPSEPELAAMLGVAVVTVREALVGLRAQGLVTTSRWMVPLVRNEYYIGDRGTLVTTPPFGVEIGLGLELVLP